MSDRKLALVGAAVLAASALLLPAPIQGDEAAQALLSKVRELNRTTRHWDDSVQMLNVTIRDRRGTEWKREMQVYIKKYAENETRTILFFRSPPEVRGMGFLQWVEPHRPDRQWLFLPELKRVRQITGRSKRDSFAGTDFSYEDLALRAELTDWTEEDAASAVLRDEPCDGRNCAVIEFVPKSEDVGYGKIRLWLDREELVAHRFEFEDRNGQLLKTLLTGDIRVVGKVPTAHRLEMRNERGRSSTVVLLAEVAYDQGLKSSMFTEHYLERGS